MSFSEDFAPLLVSTFNFGGNGIGAGATETHTVSCPAGSKIRWFKTIVSGDASSTSGANVQIDGIEFGAVIATRASQRWDGNTEQWFEFTPAPLTFLEGADGEDLTVDVRSGGNPIDDITSVIFYQLVKV